MEVPFMDSYVRLLIKTCHKRKVAAMGGMSAQIPIKGDEKANEVAMNKVKADKLREVTNGHDGTWIAHPLINKIALDIFNEHMLGPNQYHIRREDVQVSASELLNTRVPGKITEAGVKSNVEALLSYCSAWISGNGCVPINFLMEDAATAEIARLQLWQWCHYSVLLDNGNIVTPKYVDATIDSIAPNVPKLVAGVKSDNVQIAANYLKEQVRKPWASDFLTSDLMPYLEKLDGSTWVKSAL